MLTIIISLMIGAIVGGALSSKIGPGWGIACGFLAMLVVNIIIGLIVRARIKKVNNAIQEIMLAARKKLDRKVQQMQMRPQGGVKAMQKVLEKDQNAALVQAVEKTKDAESLFKWNLMLKKQIATMRMMLYYQMKNFEQVDKLMPDCLVFSDPRGLAMKIARQYRNNDSGLEKSFKKIKRFKGDDSALLYGLCAWIMVKKDKIDDAIKLLVEAKQKTDNEVILKNWEALANGKVKRFSNAGLGDDWYALCLEEPKIKQQRARHGGFHQ